MEVIEVLKVKVKYHFADYNNEDLLYKNKSYYYYYLNLNLIDVLICYICIDFVDIGDPNSDFGIQSQIQIVIVDGYE